MGLRFEGNTVGNIAGPRLPMGRNGARDDMDNTNSGSTSWESMLWVVGGDSCRLMG